MYVCMYMWKCPHVRLRFPCMAYSHCQENMPVETVLRPATNHENPSWETPVSCFQRLKSSTWSRLYQNITMEIHTDSIRFQFFLVLLGVLHAQLPATCLENGYGGYAGSLWSGLTISGKPHCDTHSDLGDAILDQNRIDFLHIGGVHVETGCPFLSIQYHPIVSTSIHSWPMSLPGLGTNLAQRSRSSWTSALVVGTQSKDVQGKAPQKTHHQNQMITWCGVKVGEESGTKGAPRKAPTRRWGEVKHQHVQFLNMSLMIHVGERTENIWTYQSP